MKRNKKRLLIILPIILILAGVIFTLTHKKEKIKKYDVGVIRKGTMEDTLEVDGVINALDKRKIFINNNLKVTKLFFKKGDFVEKNQVIMKFDALDRNKLDREIRKEKIDLKKLKRSKSEQEKLLKIGGATKNSIRDLELDIEKSKLIIEEYEEELSKMVSVIKSPFDGTIMTMNAEENYRVNLEKSLFEIADLSSVIVKIYVPEYDINKIKLGQKVEVKPAMYGDEKTFIGEINKISTLATDSDQYKNANSAYVEVEVKLKNKENGLKPGFRVTTEVLIFQKKDILLIPRVSINNENGKNYTYIVKNGNEVKKVEVTLGVENSESFEILKGLNEGDNFIKINDNSLSDGDLIEKKNDVGKKI